MTNNNKIQTAAAPKRAGNSKSSTSDLAQVWINYCGDPERKDSENALASKLDALFKRKFPDRSCQGILNGREQEVRQEAYLLLVGRYLAGNRILIAATSNGDREQIENQIKRSLSGALKSVARSMRRTAERHLELHAYGEDLDVCPQAACIHPAYQTSYWELPYEMQLRMVFAALRLGLHNGLFCSMSADIVVAMLEGGHSQSQIAKALGISRQAVHSRLAPVRKHLQGLIESQEFPRT